MPIIGVIDSSKTGNLDSSVVFPIASVERQGVSSITISSIPSIYTHLRVYTWGRTTRSAFIDPLQLRFNGDTGNNYNSAVLQGFLPSPGNGEVQANQSSMYAGRLAGSSDNSLRAIAVIDIPNYTNTNIQKTATFLSGVDYASDGMVLMGQGLWANTSAINSITVFAGVGNLAIASVQVYGIR